MTGRRGHIPLSGAFNSTLSAYNCEVDFYSTSPKISPTQNWSVLTRKTLKIVLPLIVSVAAVSLLFVTHKLEAGKRMLRNDLSHSAKILGESLRVDFEQMLRRPIEPAAFIEH